MKGVLVLEDLLLVDPSFFDSFHFSSKYIGGVVDTEEAMERDQIKRGLFWFAVLVETKEKGRTKKEKWETVGGELIYWETESLRKAWGGEG